MWYWVYCESSQHLSINTTCNVMCLYYLIHSWFWKHSLTTNVFVNTFIKPGKTIVCRGIVFRKKCTPIIFIGYVYLQVYCFSELKLFDCLRTRIGHVFNSRGSIYRVLSFILFQFMVKDWSDLCVSKTTLELFFTCFFLCIMNLRPGISISKCKYKSVGSTEAHVIRGVIRI